MAVLGRLPGDMGSASPMCDACSFAKEFVDAIAFCLQCLEYLCTDCLRHHRKIKATREHEVLNDKDMPSDTKPFEKLQSLMKCSVHQDQNVLYKCEDHSYYICMLCTKDNHVKCRNVVEIANLADKAKLRHDIKKYLSEIDDQRWKNCLTETEDNMFSLENIKTKVVERRMRLIESLNNIIQRLEDSIRETESLVTTATDKLQMKITEAKVQMSNCIESESFLRTVLRFGNATHLCIAADTFDIATTDHIKDEMLVTYKIEDCLGSDFEAKIQQLSKAKFEVIVKEDKSTEVDKTVCVKSDFVEDKTENCDIISKSTNEKTCLTPTQNVQSISISSERKLLHLKNKPALVDSESTLLVTKVCLREISCKQDDLDIAVTKQDIFAITIRCLKTAIFLCGDFSLKDTIVLKHNPLSVCFIEGYRIAIVCSDRVIRKFEVCQKVVRLYHSFSIPNHCKSISRYNSQAIVCLCTDSTVEENENSVAYHLEIRDHFSGHLRRCINLSPTPKSCIPVSVFCTDVGELMIAYDKDIEFLSESGNKKDKFSCMEISSVTGNYAGSVYIFDTKDKCIVKTTTKYKQVNVYPIADILMPSVMTYSTKSHRLVLVECTNS